MGLFLGPACFVPFQPRSTAAEAADTGTAGSEIEILGEWTGAESGYRERPSCFLVRSLPELQIFWKKHAPDEPMPSVDFEKRMLFLWVSGPSLSGYHVMKAVRVVRNGQGYILELDIRRSDTAGAGSWRNPWLMALLPKFRGDIEVVRRGDTAAGEAERMPFAVIHDMGGGDQARVAAITKVPTGGGGSMPSVSASKPAEKMDVVAPPVQPVARPAAAEGGTGDPSPTARPPAATQTAEPDPFGDAFNLDF